jgi:hypothetical protein
VTATGGGAGTTVSVVVSLSERPSSCAVTVVVLEAAGDVLRRQTLPVLSAANAAVSETLQTNLARWTGRPLALVKVDENS